MNNKILARVVAVVMAVAMLGTVSFAAATGSVDATNNTVTSSTDKTDYAAQETKTVLAFAHDSSAASIPTTPADENILAVVQISENTPGNFTYDPDRLGTNDQIVVRFGGSNGVTDEVVLNVKSDTTTLTKMSFFTSVRAANGTEYKNVVGATYEYKNGTGATVSISEYGIDFAKYPNGNVNGDEEPISGSVITVTEEVTTPATLTVVDGGILSFTCFVYGVPEGTDTTKINSRPIVNLVEE